MAGYRGGGNRFTLEYAAALAASTCLFKMILSAAGVSLLIGRISSYWLLTLSWRQTRPYATRYSPSQGKSCHTPYDRSCLAKHRHECLNILYELGRISRWHAASTVDEVFLEIDHNKGLPCLEHRERGLIDWKHHFENSPGVNLINNEASSNDASSNEIELVPSLTELFVGRNSSKSQIQLAMLIAIDMSGGILRLDKVVRPSLTFCKMI